MKEKKAWQRPELIVLTRGNPEETVLAMCKGDGTTNTASATNFSCRAGTLIGGTLCTDLSAS